MTLQGLAAHPRDRFGIAALVFYGFLSVAFIGRGLAGHFFDSYIGRTADPSVYMWFLVWWPHALAHRLNPFITRALWAPAGFNVTWTTGIPLAAIAAAPLTAAFGPVAAYNALCLVAPTLAAWICFLLCRQITGKYWPALAGGYVFGFSAYMLAESRAHLVLVLVFPAPLALWLVTQRLREKIRPAAFAMLLALTLVAEFLISLELCATIAVFGAIAFMLALAFTEGAARERIRALIRPIAAAYAMMGAVVLPYVWFFLQPGFPRGMVNSSTAYSSDLVNFIVPTSVNEIGAAGPLEWIARRFPSNPFEAGSYFGIPLLIVAASFALSRWREPLARVLTLFLAIACVLTLGPRLHIAGVTLFGMPWKLATMLPLLRDALPARFAMYAFAALAIILAIWLSDETIAPALRIAAAIAIVIFSLPNLSAAFWIRPAGTPAFFTTSQYRKYLRPDENVLVLPYGITGNSMLWQAETDMYFRMPGGWTSVTPREFEGWPIIDALLTGTRIPDAVAQMSAFMAAHRISAVIAAGGALRVWAPILAALDPSPLRTGGVWLYRPSPTVLARYRDLDAVELQRRNNQERFAALLAAARGWLDRGGNLAALTPMRVQDIGLLPPQWVAEPAVRTRNGLYLGPWPGGKIAVGVVGSYDALRPLIARYRNYASEIFFPFPRQLSDPPHGDTFMRQLVMVFDRESLARVAAMPRLIESASDPAAAATVP
jgi:hypothetical protein